jgi:hypothetical protein
MYLRGGSKTIVNPGIESMLDAYRTNRVGADDPTDRHPNAKVRGPSRGYDELTAKFIEQGLVEYDPIGDACRWIGPEQGSPEWHALLARMTRLIKSSSRAAQR